MKPVRLQLSRRKGFDLQAASRAANGLKAVKVDRSTRWGNPWTATAFADPVAEFRASIGSGPVPAIGELIHFLRGKNLACWCKAGAPCHADVLLELVNREAPV